MKKYLLMGLCSTFALVNYVNSATLDVMSWNVRRKGDDPTEHQWDNRKDLIIEEINKKRPSVIGFQEVVTGQQLDDLTKGLADHYKAIGTEGRNSFTTGRYQKWVTSLDKAKNESNPIFYDPKKLNLLSVETKEINPIGIFSHASLPRIFVHATFKDIQTDNIVHVYNTHLSSGSTWKFFKDGTNLIRIRQTKMILKDVKNIKKKRPSEDNDPTIVIMGDFNTKFEGKIKKNCTKAGFKHARDIASTIKGPENTRTGWHDKELKNIDHILIKNGKIKKYEVVVFDKGIYPSDHRPVCAKILLPE